MLGVNNVFYFSLIQGNYDSRAKNSPKPIPFLIPVLMSFSISLFAKRQNHICSYPSVIYAFYPISKQEILEQIGDEIVKAGADQYLSVREILAPIRQETFSCAAEFYCALLGA